MKIKVKYEDILNIDYLYEMYYLIRKTTKNKDKLFKYELFLSSNLINILNMLRDKKYVHGKYNIFLITDPKYRIIMSENLNDKIINHLISKYILYRAIDFRLLNCNVATRINKGTKEAYNLFKKYINKIKTKYDNIYVLKCDISKYFYSVNHEILIKKLEKIIEDKECIKLIQNIISSTDSTYVNENIEKIINNEKEKIKNKKILESEKNRLIKMLSNVPKYKKGYGLPIGNMSSQILAIFYLNDLDHYIKEKLGIKYYVRYMDDFILIHWDKEYLKECLKEIKIKLRELDLCLNAKTNIFNMKHGVTFLGYRFFLKNKKLIIKIRTDSKKRIKKKYKILKERDPDKYLRVKASYNGYLKIANTKMLTYILDNISVKNIE